MKRWRRAQLREITTKIGSGATPRGGEESYKAEGIPLIRSLNVHDAGFSYRNLAFLDDAQASTLANVEVRPGDVLLNITGASVARCCLVAEDVCPARVNQHVSIIRPISGKVLPKFLHYLLVSPTYKKLLLQTGEDNGSTRQAITKAQIETFAIDFPESIPEQQRIVAILDEAFEAIATAKANTEKNLQNARALFDNYLDAAFTKQATGWAVKRLGEIATTQYGLSVPMNNDSIGYKIFRMGEIQGGLLIDTGAMKYADISKSEFEKYKLREGDVLFNRTNSYELVGKTGIFSEDGDYCFASYLIRIVVNKSIMSPHYLNWLMNSPDFQSTAKRFAARSVSQANINATHLSNMEIRFPTSLRAQTAIVEQLANMRDEIRALQLLQNRKLAELDTLRQSLLHQAFTGNL